MGSIVRADQDLACRRSEGGGDGLRSHHQMLCYPEPIVRGSTYLFQRAVAAEAMICSFSRACFCYVSGTSSAHLDMKHVSGPARHTLPCRRISWYVLYHFSLDPSQTNCTLQHLSAQGLSPGSCGGSCTTFPL